MKTTTITLQKENMKFSAGHFTIFSATERERLHGHNWNVGAKIVATVGENGMCFDYGIYKKKLEKLCRDWNEFFILPNLSPHLSFEEQGELLYVIFSGERIPFLKKDVLRLEIANATVEEFSRLMLEHLRASGDFEKYGVTQIEVSVFSGPGQSATAKWEHSK